MQVYGGVQNMSIQDRLDGLRDPSTTDMSPFNRERFLFRMHTGIFVWLQSPLQFLAASQALRWPDPGSVPEHRQHGGGHRVSVTGAGAVTGAVAETPFPAGFA